MKWQVFKDLGLQTRNRIDYYVTIGPSGKEYLTLAEAAALNGDVAAFRFREDCGKMPPDELTEFLRQGGVEDSAFDKQEGGEHYKNYAIQPAEYVHKNRIPYLEGSVIYYVTRWRDKNGLADIDKAIHTLQLLKELENGKQPRKD